MTGIFHAFSLMLMIHYAFVSVKTCDGKYAVLFADARHTMHMPNPFVVIDGEPFQFFPSSRKCYVVQYTPLLEGK